MSEVVHVPLTTSAQQAASLSRLQAIFAQACNALVPVVRERRCWNRVALHHLTYHELRSRFPQLGSQMACNAIYSVCRVCRLLFQHPQSPWHLSRLDGRPLPSIEFAPTAPVYFDRHTLSLKADGLSMYTLDGRMRFSLSLPPEVVKRFQEERLREIALSRQSDRFVLSFQFAGEQGAPGDGSAGELPEYVIVHEDGSARRAARPEPLTVAL